MGAIQTPTKAMHGWTIETRGESFYLHDPENGTEEHDKMRFERHDNELMLSTTDLNAVIASLDEAARLVEHDEPRFGVKRILTVRRVGDKIAFSGFDFELSYMKRHKRRWCGSIEIGYSELADLRSQLAAARQ